ncbi:MAG: MotA/TolQ/ExbB proton channel family protein [Elusimicrobia bacterium]|nr:MotA/TolQ/ExbB proton channel family protein [Elusimicrobiota bacterium]
MFIFERWFYFRKIQVDPEKVLLKIRDSVIAGDKEEALRLLGDTKDNPLLTLIQTGIRGSDLPKEQVAELLRASQIRQRAALERNLGVLGTLGNVAPFIGLLGTVLGIIQAFHDLAGPAAESQGANVVAVGIAEALVATAAGLFVAIPAVVFYNAFLKKARALLLEMEVITAELAVLLSLRQGSARAGAGHGR